MIIYAAPQTINICLLIKREQMKWTELSTKLSVLSKRKGYFITWSLVYYFSVVTFQSTADLGSVVRQCKTVSNGIDRIDLVGRTDLIRLLYIPLVSSGRDDIGRPSETQLEGEAS